MIKGLDVFSKRLSKFSSEYVLIGGIACSMLFERKNLNFRATKDFDIVLITKSLNKGFVEDLWQFIKDGGYQNKQRSNGKPQFYRFDKPIDDSFPYMLELFSANEIFAKNHYYNEFMKIKVSDEVSSLSAILLDTDYYNLILNGTKIINGIQVLSAEYLLLFKVKAWLDLSARKENGEKVDSHNINKHRNDIFRLFTILTESIKLELPQTIKNDFNMFIEKMRTESFNPSDLGIKTKKDDILDYLVSIFVAGRRLESIY